MLNRFSRLVEALPRASLVFTTIVASSLLAVPREADAASTLRIAISLSDVPVLWAAPDGGFEGARFGGYTVFDPLVTWDLSSETAPSRLVPGLAESWTVDPDNKKRWTFKLREAVFHDGSPWNADAALWNLDAFTNQKAPQYNALRAGIARTRTQSIASYGKIDDHTIFIETKEVNSFLLFELSSMFFASPARFAEVGNDWQKFSQNPSGTGPYKFVSLRPGQELELAANTQYWDKKRVPKMERLTILPVPEPNTRVAALRSGQVDLIETLPPDSIEALKGAGFKITANVYPHTWIWRLNFNEGTPFADVRIRKAANLAIDRESIVELVEKTAEPAKGYAPPDAPWFGKPSFNLRYDPTEAKKLLAEAGYGPNKPVNVKIVISSSGGGQMVPLSMNEQIQENLRAVGINVTYDVRDFTAMINMLRAGAKSVGADGLNVAMTMQEPGSGIASYESTLIPPAGSNWGSYKNPDFDAAIKAARAEFDPAKQEEAMKKVNEVLTDDAAALLVVHDFGPRAMSSKVKGFIQARNWYQDYTSIQVSE
ncbi:MAG: dppA 3 [Rhizobium sp.]|nr:dppA 3 [Rhizobium sp.]